MAKAQKITAKKLEAALPTLEDTVQGHIDSLELNGLMSEKGLDVSMDQIKKEVAAGIIDTDLEGKQLELEIKKLQGRK